MENTKKQSIFLALIVSLGGFLFGFDAAVISGVNTFITIAFDLSSLQLGWVVTSVTISSAVAMFISGGLSDKYGRKKILIVVALLYSISAICSAFAPTYETLVIARLVGGLAFGAALVLVPVYIAETVPAKYRGAMVSINQLAIVTGFSAAYFSNYFLLALTNDATFIANNPAYETNVWRCMLGVECLPALLYFILLFFVPNSPRWLMMKNRNDEAKHVISKYNGEANVEQLMNEITESFKEKKVSVLTTLAEFFKKRYRSVLLIGLVVGIAQMSVGINAVFFYATNIFELTGIGTDASFVQSVWVGIINVIFTLIAIFLIDRIGRRPLLLTGLLGIVVSLCIVAYGFSIADYNLDSNDLAEFENTEIYTKLLPLQDVSYESDLEFTKALRSSLTNIEMATHKGALIKAAGNLNAILILMGILGFVASFAFSLGPVMWVLLSEIFPNIVRSVAISLIGLVNSLTSTIVVGLFPWQLDNMGNTRTFLIYAVCAIVAFLILFKILPETKGKSLEEIEKELIA